MALKKPLSPSEITKIVDLLVAGLSNRLADRDITLALTDAAKQHVAEHGYDPVYGARPLKRYLQHEVETPIGRAIIKGDVAEGATITVDVDSDGQWRVETI